MKIRLQGTEDEIKQALAWFRKELGENNILSVSRPYKDHRTGSDTSRVYLDVKMP